LAASSTPGPCGTTRSVKMVRHGEPPCTCTDRSSEHIEEDRIRRYRQRLREEYSESTQAMFAQFARMHRELESMGLSPEKVAKYWDIQ
jgi:hypothetical protein